MKDIGAVDGVVFLHFAGDEVSVGIGVEELELLLDLHDFKGAWRE